MINAKRTSTPLEEPVSVELVKLHLREELVDLDNDAYIALLITAARTDAEDRLSRCLVSTEWAMSLDSFPPAIKLSTPPLISVDAVQYLDVNNVLRTLDPADYVVDTVNEPGYIVPAPGKAWPATYPTINAVAVTYTAGYGTTGAAVPASLRNWVMLAVGDMYERRTASAETPAVPQQFAQHLLDPFYRYEV